MIYSVERLSTDIAGAMQILIAPNAFKNSLEADEVALAIKRGAGSSGLEGEFRCFPVGDGGDGTGKLLLDHCQGEILQRKVHDPIGREIVSSFGLMDGGQTAVIEMANASGLRLLTANELNPLRASSYGTGELILHALDNGASQIILCIGGSATVDGGVGILSALGFQFLNKKGQPLNNIPETLTELDFLDLSKIDTRINNCKFIVLCDVDNILLGEHGAAAVFGPQKGASQNDVSLLDASLTKLRDVVFQQTGKDIALLKGGGAAGGIAASLGVLLNAQLVNGIDYFFVTHFDRALENAIRSLRGREALTCKR